MSAANDMGASRSSTRAWTRLAWAWLAAGTALVGVYAAVEGAVAESVLYSLLAYAAVAVGAVALARRHGRVPRWWGLVLAGATLWVTADLVWTIVELTGSEVPFPSPVDAVYFAGYPLVLVGILAAWRTVTVRPLGALLDCGIVAVAGGALVWTLVVDPTASAPYSLTTALATLYPVLDLALLVGVVQLLVLPRLRGTRSLQALALALVAYGLADCAYAYEAIRDTYASGALTDVGWLVSYVLLGFAAVHPSADALGQARPTELRLSARRLAVLAFTCLAVVAASALQLERGHLDTLLFVVVATILIAFYFARMGLIFGEQQQAEADVRESRELYRALVEQNRDLVALLDDELRIVYISAAATPMLGWTPEELTGARVPDLVHPEDRDQMRDQLRRLAEGQTPRPPTIRLRTREDGWIWVETSARYVYGPGGSRQLLTTSRDVSERHWAEEALANTTRALQTLIDSVPVAILETDLDGIVTVWNPAAERLFGYPAHQVVGRPSPLLPRERLAPILGRLAAGETLYFEATRHRSDGSPLDVIVSSVPIRSESGEIVRAIAIFLDVTEQRQLEEQLRQSQRLEAIGQLAGGVAHDFNNLLTAISGYHELAMREVDGNETLHGHLAAIGHAAGRATELTRQLLAFSRRQILQPTVFDLNAAVERTNALLGRVLPEHIEVVTRLDPDGCSVRADESQVEQVLMNLAVNARDAMPAGGTLTIETENVTLSRGDTSPFGGREGEYVRLRVTDTGCGMDEETQRRAFEPFFTTKEHGKGTGLGLATVYGIVNQSGGSVTVRSAQDEGSVFEVLLPHTWQAPEHRHEPEPATRYGTEVVLLVEDEPVVRELTQEMLEEHGYSVVAAATPAEAVAAAAREQIDLLLTDVVMPGMNGRQLAGHLRRDRPDLRVLYTSGYSDDAALQDGALEPLSTFLQKPYSAAELAEAVRRTLDAAA